MRAFAAGGTLRQGASSKDFARASCCCGGLGAGSRRISLSNAA